MSKVLLIYIVPCTKETDGGDYTVYREIEQPGTFNKCKSKVQAERRT